MSAGVSISLRILYTHMTDMFRRRRRFDGVVRKQDFDAMIQAVADVGVNDYHVRQFQLSQMMWKEWETVRRLNQQELDVVKPSLLYTEHWREEMQADLVAEQAQQNQAINAQKGRATAIDTTISRLDVAVSERIARLAAELPRVPPCYDLDPKTNDLNIEWMLDSLRAASTAHDFCKSVESGHTDSTLESVCASHTARDRRDRRDTRKSIVSGPTKSIWASVLLVKPLIALI